MWLCLLAAGEPFSSSGVGGSLREGEIEGSFLGCDPGLVLGRVGGSLLGGDGGRCLGGDGGRCLGGDGGRCLGGVDGCLGGEGGGWFGGGDFQDNGGFIGAEDIGEEPVPSPKSRLLISLTDTFVTSSTSGS